jgi:hypothetical protein
MRCNLIETVFGGCSCCVSHFIRTLFQPVVSRLQKPWHGFTYGVGEGE